MNITVQPKPILEKTITENDVKPGFVFKYLDSGTSSDKKVIALKLTNGVVLLKFSGGDDWFEFKKDKSWEDSSVEIIGELTEIIVDPNLE